jgi:hypothetical protein
METTVDRRTFLQLSAMAAAVALIPWMEACKAKPLPTGLERPDFLSQALDKGMLEEIGKAYLRKNPEENTAELLAGRLMKNHPGMEHMDKDALASFFRKEISADFLNDRTLVISGWVLSVTEARQCALFQITDPESVQGTLP